MQLFAFGVNHTTASIDLRERVSFTPEQAGHALHDLARQTEVDEAVIVSTCNRTELYCCVPEDRQAVLEWFSQYRGVPLDHLRKHLYLHQRADAARHLLRVASGLDSMILGEPQILGQIKTAYQQAYRAGTVGNLLGRLFQHSFTVAKQVRTDTAIGSSPVSVAFAAVRLAQQIFGELTPYTALLIGAGETIELAARHLRENGLRRMIVANRTLERARNLATQFGGYAITLPEIPDHLAEADVVISSTASDQIIVHADQVKQAIKTRKRRPVFMVDIAVPRDIDPAVGKLDDVYLYTVDDLNEVIQENLRSRRQAALQAEEIVDTQVNHFMGWLQSLEAVDTICEIRAGAEQAKQRLLRKAQRMIDNGKPASEALHYLAHTLTNTLLHTPCTQVRQAGYAGNLEMIGAARRIFQLPDAGAASATEASSNPPQPSPEAKEHAETLHASS
jgi:glutamyl-tRNA reductase